MALVSASHELIVQLAQSYGVATTFWGFDGQLREVKDDVLAAVLHAMGVDASNDVVIEMELAARQDREWRSVLPVYTVVREDRGLDLHVHVPHGARVWVSVELEDSTFRELNQIDDFTEPKLIDGALVGQASFRIEPGFPLGYHTVHAWVETDGETVEHARPLTVVPHRLPEPSRSWGMMVQLYSVRSRRSWGIGDLRDLAEMVSLFGERGADFILINPLHAAEPTGHMSPSPYLPVTRRFFNPIYIRPEDIAEVAYLSGPERSLVEWAGEAVIQSSTRNDLIDRDAVWKAKREALEVIYNSGRSQARERAFRAFRRTEGEGLEDFALWCALYEKYDGAIPPELGNINAPGIAKERRELADRIDFWAWLQWIMDLQLGHAQHVAHESGMQLGICHDLAVGVHPAGSDRFTIPGAFAEHVGVGAPPDMYNQLGQNWSQPPWNPTALEAMGYAPLRDMARTVLRHAGAIRVDHIMGLFRLWWIPQGCDPVDGAYVSFNHEAMVGILLLEAYRAGAVVIGEDLGTVEPWVREYLADRGILGTSVFWFEKTPDGDPLHAGDYRVNTFATVDTHDLPPAAGYIAGEHVDLRDRLGLLSEPVEKVRQGAIDEIERVRARLVEYGLADEGCSEREFIEGLHKYIARTPSQLLGISLTDAVGERRAQNQPGTDQEYPNWRIPLADGTEQVVLTEDLDKNPRLNSLLAEFVVEFEASQR
ncbi:MAG: 4-alpha-glucanotransferase [Actinomycetaceae bacterium]|nr:4-alpha-glucanotransferase [Arcanobacterium sp.]MDD7505036.1 4-alpha-glucanotransferase [Actinomycetaceae bacterium]